LLQNFGNGRNLGERLKTQMCGRFVLNRAVGELRRRFVKRQVVASEREFTPSNNIAPATPVAVLTTGAIEVLMWGIQRQKLVINARSETVAQKFAKDINERRCVVPADGYFEWKKETKQPYFFREQPGELMFFAGLYTSKGQFVIITREAAPELMWIHDRMPVILSEEQIEVWEGSGWSGLLAREPARLSWYPVARMALRSGHTGEECVREIKEAKKTQRTLDDLLKPAIKAEIKKLL
jgi:putative SOS response-associated peptidase YedK